MSRRAGSGEPVILIVDDFEPIRAHLVCSLESLGLPILEAANGEAALALLETNPVSLVISDVEMPQGDGVWLIERITERAIKVFVIFVTGRATELSAKLMALGALAVFSKPWNSDELHNIVSKALDTNLPMYPRRDLRLSVQLPVVILNNDTQAATAYNISKRGIYIEASEAAFNYAEGDQLTLELPKLGAKYYSVRCIVRWRKRGADGKVSGYGLEFETDDLSQQALNLYLNQISTGLSHLSRH